MLFHVRMDVSIPRDPDATAAEKLLADERAQCSGVAESRHLASFVEIVGHYANISVFDVENPLQLHQILTSPPLFPFMKVTVTPLCHHPSSIGSEDG